MNTANSNTLRVNQSISESCLCDKNNLSVGDIQVSNELDSANSRKSGMNASSCYSNLCEKQNSISEEDLDLIDNFIDEDRLDAKEKERSLDNSNQDIIKHTQGNKNSLLAPPEVGNQILTNKRISKSYSNLSEVSRLQ